MSNVKKILKALKWYNFKKLEETPELIRGYGVNSGIWGIEIDAEKEEIRWYMLDKKPQIREDWDTLSDTMSFDEFIAGEARA